MATTNFLAHNPPEANQQDDATYSSYSLRIGGVPVDAVIPSPWLNKVLHQSTIFAAAFAQMLAGKNFSTSDADQNALASVLTNVITAADVKPALRAVAFSSSLVLDCSLSNGFEVLLTGNVSSITFLHLVPNQPILLVFVQDGAGGRTVAFPASVKSPGVVSPTAGDTSAQQFIVRSDSNLHPTAPMTVS